MKDLVCGPRPIGLVHRDSTIRFLGKGHEEAEQNAKVGLQGQLVVVHSTGSCRDGTLHPAILLLGVLHHHQHSLSTAHMPASLAMPMTPTRSHPCVQEYGLPSSHVMNSVCFNFFTVHYLLENDVVGPETAGVPP